MAVKAIYEINKLVDSKNYDFPKPFLTIIGDGPERKSLEKLVQQLHLQNQVHFKGYKQGQELVKILNQHKFLLVPSIWEEPFGIVALEGMACGCVPIVSDGGGLPEAIGNGGIIFQRKNISSLVTAMTSLQQQNDLYYSLRQKALLHLYNYSIESINQKYLALLKIV